ncbi:hypothetical protein EV182_003794 [Spiromyces aspiralis]|uniref:Uncharacterized protein n=1 Tax=Spiromyces aspiralis TaxID=68401 RepID=A0ACC1HGF4_9FUNG|nr:hypothetical protein EV182_003794 [Spiromyces aspiralis]
MDGFHLYRAQLDMMDDPKLAHRRRGAHWTFDGQGFVDLIERIVREPGETMLAPTFDHAEKDPRPDDIAVRPEHCMVILEGLYLQLKSLSPWSKLPELVDEAWWIESRDLDAVKERLVVRYLEAGMTESREKAIFRIDDSDRLNGTFILQNRISDPDYIIYN